MASQKNVIISKTYEGILMEKWDKTSKIFPLMPSFPS